MAAVASDIWTQNWPAPNVSGFIAQLVERRTGIARSRVQRAPLKYWIFFRLLYAIVKIAIITARIILHLVFFFYLATLERLYGSRKKTSWCIVTLLSYRYSNTIRRIGKFISYFNVVTSMVKTSHFWSVKEKRVAYKSCFNEPWWITANLQWFASSYDWEGRVRVILLTRLLRSNHAFAFT